MEESPQSSFVARWLTKFGYAFRGLAVALREEVSFAVHLPVAFAVLVIALQQGVSRTEWLLLVVCVTVVLCAEMLNSSIERLATAITTEVDPSIRDALDIASGAVFVSVIGGVTVGVIVLFL